MIINLSFMVKIHLNNILILLSYNTKMSRGLLGYGDKDFFNLFVSNIIKLDDENSLDDYTFSVNNNSELQLKKGSTVIATFTTSGIIFNGNINVGNIIATNITGTLLTASQPNITSLGTLTSLDINGRVLIGSNQKGSLSFNSFSTFGTIISINNDNGNFIENGDTTQIDMNTGFIALNRAIGGIGGNSINYTSTMFLNSSNGNVGIGTTTPSTALDVIGDITATNINGTLATAAQPNITSLGTLTGLGIGSGANISGTTNLSLRVNGFEKFRLDNTINQCLQELNMNNFDITNALSLTATTGNITTLNMSGDINDSAFIEIPGDTRKGIAKVYNSGTGDAFGIEQISGSQSELGVPEFRTFTSNIGSSVISTGVYTGVTSFKHFSTTANDGVWNIESSNATSTVPAMFIHKQNSSTINQVFFGFERNSTLFSGTGEGDLRLDGSGNLVLQNPSDIRLKENIINYTNGYNKIKELRTVEYEWIDPQKKLEIGRIVGFIAQEVQIVLPKAVGTFKREGIEYFGVSVSNMIPFLWSALKTVINKVETLETEVNVLKTSKNQTIF